MTIYIDVTEVVGIRATTGVQRVVRGIVRGGMAAGSARGQAIVPVVAVGHAFHRLNDDGMAMLAVPSGSPARPRDGIASRLKAALRRHAFGVFALAQRIGFTRRMRRIVATGADPRPVEPERGDVVVLIDTFWNGSTVLTAARRAKAAGARIVLVVYDLFPIRQPDAVDPQLAHVFPRLLGRAVALSDAVLTISRQVGADVLDHFGPALAPERVRHFYLGQDFGQAAAQADGDAGLPPAFTARGSARYLMVGTIEPRRGHAYVLDAFERLWARGGQQRLMVVGRVGWQMDAFLARCAAHPKLGSRLFLIHDASDRALAAAIRRSDAMIVASLFEGFGLPLVEGLLAGRPVLASDIPIFREIADGTPLFFRCGDSDALAEAAEAFEDDPSPWRARAAAFRWLDWDGSSRMFLDQMSAALSGEADTPFPQRPAA